MERIVVPRAQVTTKTIQKASQSYALTDLSEEDHQEFYSGFADSVLWPILHYRIDLAEFTRRDLSGYLRVNQHFAEELLLALKRRGRRSSGCSSMDMLTLEPDESG